MGEGEIEKFIADYSKEHRALVTTFGLQLLGFAIAVSGLATLPIGDGPYEVPNDRLQLSWFVTIWSLIAGFSALVGVHLKSQSWLLMSLMVMAITSTIAIVSTNLFAGFTRTCHHCPGADSSLSYSYHTAGQPCPYYVSHCEHGRSLFTAGSVFQSVSLYLLMFIVAWKRNEFAEESQGEVSVDLS
eukprot:c16607_g1_i1.p1 GENE.c16607_g1_i1~~c16607_g1_i1.p1  ORF type:complete len:204 (-),score=68.03 c16607_g1_i1:110-667(-)